ncbi:MAG TPA: CGNR zinc finger domain-containing protein [Trebonia sp.]
MPGRPPLARRPPRRAWPSALIGTWRRLKVCHNARCHEVFFDQSKNNSRTWFDTAACANALNLRAYRERRKAARFSDLSERDPG